MARVRGSRLGWDLRKEDALVCGHSEEPEDVGKPCILVIIDSLAGYDLGLRVCYVRDWLTAFFPSLEIGIFLCFFFP